MSKSHLQQWLRFEVVIEMWKSQQSSQRSPVHKEQNGNKTNPPLMDGLLHICNTCDHLLISLPYCFSLSQNLSI